MELHNVIPGSPEWLALRAQPGTFTASEAPAMMGASPYMTRSDLLAQKHTGLVAEVDASTQRRFDDGHEAEAAYRPVAEEIIGDELYPCTGSVMVDGLRLLASFDGLTMDRKVGFEHKLFNMKIADAIASHNEPGPAYYWQLEQQLLVSGAEKIMFVTSAGTAQNATTCWYESKPERRAALIAGWKQFAEDLKNYTAPAAAPVVVAEPVQALPAVAVQVEGSIVVRDNFKTFETALRDFLDHRLIREPKTDQDFADLEVQIKAMKGAEEALKAAEGQMLAQVQSIDQAKKTKDMLAKLVRDNRLMAEKLLKDEKERRRGEIVAGGIAEFTKHIAALNDRLGKAYMPTVPADFGGCIKGMKSMASMENAVATELARVKIAANEIADRLQKNLDYLRDNASEFKHLFADTAEIIKKAPDDLQALVQNRITAHKAAVQAEQDRIREEAAATARKKLIDEAAQKNEMALQEIQGIQQQVMIATLGRAGVRKGGTIECIRETLAETEAWTITEEKFGVLTTAAQAAKDKAIADIRAQLSEAEAKAATQATIAAAAQTSAPAVQAAVQEQVKTGTGMLSTEVGAGAPVVRHIPTAAVLADEKPTLKLGEICERLGFTVTAEFLATLGFKATVERNAKLYRESQWPAICEALIQHITQVVDLQPA